MSSRKEKLKIIMGVTAYLVGTSSLLILGQYLFGYWGQIFIAIVLFIIFAIYFIFGDF